MSKLLFIPAVIGMVCSCCGSDNMMERQVKLQVLKKENAVHVRSYFSAEQDVLITVAKGANNEISFANTRLISAIAPMRESAFANGPVFHQSGDDVTPWNLNDTYIGANHGCSDGRELVVAQHGLTAAELGSEWTDEASSKFYIIKIVNPDTFWILSENKGKDEIWNFGTTMKGSVLKNVDGSKTLNVGKIGMVQILPACRIKEQKYLVNGKTPLEDGKAVSCEFLDVVEDYDIIAPDSLLASIRKNPGKEVDFVGGDLDSVLTVRTSYRFLPMGACTVDHKVRANRKFNIGQALFVMTAPLNAAGYDMREQYVPKTLPFEKAGVRYDFKSVQDVTAKFAVPLHFNSKEKNIEDSGNLPDRFIQFLVKTENGKPVRKIGFAMGYSLIEGLSQPALRAKTVNTPLIIYNTGKTYPYALDGRIGTVQAGAEFHCFVYRQYFNPSAYENATGVYWHKEGDSCLLYVDYHKSVENDVIKLPGFLSGKKISIVEKTPSVKLLTEQTVPADGLVLSVEGQYGYMILKLD